MLAFNSAKFLSGISIDAWFPEPMTNVLYVVFILYIISNITKTFELRKVKIFSTEACGISNSLRFRSCLRFFSARKYYSKMLKCRCIHHCANVSQKARVQRLDVIATLAITSASYCTNHRFDSRRTHDHASFAGLSWFETTGRQEKEAIRR